MSDSVEELVKKLAAAGRWPDPDLVDAVTDAGAEAAAPLGELVRSDLRRRPEEFALPTLIGLLGDVARGSKAVAAAEDLCGLYRRYDDDTLEQVNDAMVKLGAMAALEPLAKVVTDRVVRWYGRVMAAAASVRLARSLDVERRAVAGLLRDLLDDRSRTTEPSDGDRNLIAAAAWGLAVLPDPDARGLIEKVFARGWIDEPAVTPAKIEEAFARGPTRRPAPERFAVRYRRRWQDRRMDADWLESERKRKQ